MRPSESPETSILTRREAIRRAALLAGVALSPEWLGVVGCAQSAAAKTYLAAAQGATLAAAADRIIPRTDTPGAADVGVAAFIDRLYGEFMTPAEQQLLTAGIAGDRDARQNRRTAPGSPRSAPLSRTPCCARSPPRSRTGIQARSRLIRSATILGYFTSEQVGRNVLHYDPVPGAYNGCVPIDQVGRRNWTT